MDSADFRILNSLYKGPVINEALTVVGHSPEEVKQNAEELLAAAQKAGLDRAKIAYNNGKIYGVDLGTLTTPQEVQDVQDKQVAEFSKNKPENNEGPEPEQIDKITLGDTTYEVGANDPKDDGIILRIEKYPKGYYITGGTFRDLQDYAEGEEPSEGYGYALDLDGNEIDEDDLHENVQNDMRKDIEDLKKLYDNPDEEFAKKNYGSVDGYKKMIRRKIEDLVSKLDAPYPVYLEADQRPKDEVDAEEVVGDGPDAENVDSAVEKEEKETKNESKSINNLNKVKVMTEDKSIFDKLFEQVMGEADDEAMELGIDLDDAGGDEGFGAEGEDITITLTPDHVQLLKDILAQVEPEEGEGEEDGEEAEEMDMGYEEEEANPFEEENQHTKDGAKTGVDPSDGGGKSSELPGDALGGKSSGSADASATDETGTKQTGMAKKPGVVSK